MYDAQADAYQVPILTYHSIDDSGSIVSTARETFRRQIQCLSEAGYQTISFKELATRLHERRPLPARTIVIAFDDGYRNVFTDAFPILQKYGLTGTVFLITDYCGKSNNWPGNLTSLERQPLLSWSEIEEMRRGGFEFGAHTLTHPDLTGIPIQQAEREIVQSQREIQDRLGAEVTSFAYPYGSYGSEIKEIVRNHFLAACSTKLGKVESGSDPFLLKRIDSYYLANHQVFNRLSTKSLNWYLQFRQIFRELKHLGLRSSERYGGF